MRLVYGDTLSFQIVFKDKKANKKIDISQLGSDVYVWFVCNDQQKERKIWKEIKSQAIEIPFEDYMKILYPGEYDCEVGIRYGKQDHYRYQTKQKFTLTIEEGERVPVQEVYEDLKY